MYELPHGLAAAPAPDPSPSAHFEHAPLTHLEQELEQDLARLPQTSYTLATILVIHKEELWLSFHDVTRESFCWPVVRAHWLPAGKLRGATRINSVIRGVQIGAQSYSFRDMSLDACIDAFVKVGLGECELSEGHVDPPGVKGAELKKWRVETPLSYFEEHPQEV